MNIITKEEFEKQVSSPKLQSFRLNFNTSLDNNAHCAICTSKRSEVFTTYLTGGVPGNVSDCRSYTAIYAASLS
ncbi:putative LRR receptor-like serine/threonine-protein kinase, partial [Trifolium medium]|nr:putative LRR receptor-like serine/threonine-protein kinase [Trifolium medium]